MFMKVEQTVQGCAARMALCVALSLVVHGVLVWVLLWWAGCEVGRRRVQERSEGRARTLQIITQEPEVEQARPFAKTDPDAEEVPPPQVAEFIGKRNAVASGGPEAVERRSEAPVPTQEGEEREDLVTFDQEHQEGSLEHDGREETQRERPVAMGVPLPPLPPPSPGAEAPETEQEPEEVPEDSTARGVASALAESRPEDGDVLVRRMPDEEEGAAAAVQVPLAVQPNLMVPDLPRGMAGAVYDPSLAEHLQPRPVGFRTRERRTRSTGRFVLGRKPSLNVAATPLGRYEEEIYRRIAYFWNIACDDHRGDIVPGSIVISLRINARGQLVNMDLMRRSGASMSQQSFTFGAIRRATLPPMPPAVQQEMVGDLLELIFQFNFD